MAKTYFRSSVSRGIKSGAKGIDREFKHDKGVGVIRGYAVISKGVLREDIRYWENDDKTLDQVVKYSNEISSGLKTRFGHPNMSSQALGTFLGRSKNFRRDGDIVRADLFIDETAYKTPTGDLASYVLDLAESDPDSFGASIVFDKELEYRLEKNGTPQKDKQGKELPALVRVKKMFGADIVDEPAATSGMFGNFFNESVELSAKATEFLDKLLCSPDAVERVISFFSRYAENRVDIEQGDRSDLSNKQQKREGGMEMKDITVAMLKSERPDLFAAFRKDLTVDMLKAEHSDLVTALRQEGVTEERARCGKIVETSHAEFSGMGMEKLIESAVNEGKSVDAALASMRKKRLDDLAAAANPAPGASGDNQSAPKTHLERAREYAHVNKCSLQEALSITAEARK